jgi:hypothetical protein
LTKNWLAFLHHTRLQMSVTALALTLASGRVLVGRVQWQPALIVALCTYLVYNLDNLLDWRHEQAWLHALRPLWKAYLAWCAVTLPAAAGGVLLLLLDTGLRLVTLILGLGAASLAVTWLTRRPWKRDRPQALLWAERLFVSLVWALASVLVPVRYAGEPVVAQTLMSIAYVWQLGWVASMIWDLTSTGTTASAEQEQSLPVRLGERAWLRALKIVTLSATVLALVDILLGYFPWHNAAVAIAPLTNWSLVSLWPRFRSAPLRYCNLFFLLNALCALAVVGVYALAEA